MQLIINRVSALVFGLIALMCAFAFVGAAVMSSPLNSTFDTSVVMAIQAALAVVFGFVTRGSWIYAEDTWLPSIGLGVLVAMLIGLVVLLAIGSGAEERWGALGAPLCFFSKLRV